MRYYHGNPPQVLQAGTPWPEGTFIPVSAKTEVAPGIVLLPGVSHTPGTLELKELSMALKGPKGAVVIVGCSHPGVKNILQEASSVDPHVYLLFGGLHQIQKSDPEVQQLAAELRDQVKVERVAPGHCTGEPEFAALKKAYGDKYVYAGAGTVVDLP
jgi:7,8-dihydropterin-6-yl-methyl-4-(beta-D-ribofuranosyl)aminobenzene 5'-phosphate synthase